MQTFNFFFLVLSLVFFSCSGSDDTVVVEPPEDAMENPSDDPQNPDDSTNMGTGDKPNILLIIADDMGLDASPGYNIGSIKPSMPNLQNMISSGITFNNVWSNPTCTPTRAAILTGKFGFRTNMTKVGDELSTSETSLQAYIEQNSNEQYSNAVIGKWHLANDVNHPTNMGIQYFAGFLRGGVPSYTDWDFVENGTTAATTEYTTTKFTNEAIDWIEDQSQPWFLWLAYNAPHTPFHLPPDDLHSQGSLPADQASITANPMAYYMASLEAMDSEMGRLLDSMTAEERDNTIIIFIGDNGTPTQVGQAYGSRRNKDTAYQGGVNVPMVVSGKGVTRSNDSEDALINVTDLFVTIADIAGATTTEVHDSKTFTGLLSGSDTITREFAYTEVGREGTTADVAIRNETHKYIRFADESEALYQLKIDPLESQNLLDNSSLSNEDAVELERLTAELTRIKQ